MLRRVREVGARGSALRIADAAFPAPFPARLEFNAPEHEHWNIVHIGMLMPGAHQIYVCADNCMRGVVMTAAEMGAQERFSEVILEEDDLYDGNLEEVTIEGVSDCINKLPYRPRAVLVFLVCLHHFVGTDERRVYEELEHRFPDIDFVRCWMDPIMQKRGLTPDQKLRKSMLDVLRPLPVRKRCVALVGDNLALRRESDLWQVIEGGGITALQIQDAGSYDEYLQMGAAGLLLTRAPAAEHALRQTCRRLERPGLYLPCALGYEEIDALTGELCAALGLPAPDAVEKRERAEEALDHLRQALGERPIVIDTVAVARPLGLARLLLSHGLRVTGIYADALSPAEEDDFSWLQTNAPDLVLHSTSQVQDRVLHRHDDRILAVGPRAAWFAGTAHFVNIIDDDGMWGYSEIVRLCALMEEAALQEKDTRSIVPRKGLGCACVLA